MISKVENKYLSDIYYTLGKGGSFSTANYIHKEVKKRADHKISLGKIQKWLNKQKTYVNYRDIKRKFKRQRIYVNTKNAIWSLDTMNLNHLSKYNKFKHILVIIDLLSRYLWAVPITSLKSIEVKKILTKMFKKQSPSKVTSDAGSEFKSNLLQSFLKDKGIDYYYSRNNTKSPRVERVIRNIRSKMQKALSHNNTHKWVKLLPDIVSTLNHTYNRAIKTTPHEAYFNLNDVNLYRKQQNYATDKKLNKSTVKKNRVPRSKNVYKKDRLIKGFPMKYLEFTKEELRITFLIMKLKMG